jgi:hypothetical protein
MSDHLRNRVSAHCAEPGTVGGRCAKVVFQARVNHRPDCPCKIGRVHRFLGRDEVGQHIAPHVADQSREDGLFARKELVERPDGDTGALSHRVGVEPGKARAQQDILRSGEDGIDSLPTSMLPRAFSGGEFRDVLGHLNASIFSYTVPLQVRLDAPEVQCEREHLHELWRKLQG